MRRVSRKDALDAVFERAKKIDLGESELRADMARHLCILVSGYVDQSIKAFTKEYVEKRSGPTVVRYVEASNKNLTNLKAEKLTNHLLSFDSAWRVPLAALIADERKSALDSLIDVRHKIAHGNPSDVTIARVQEYYNEIDRLLAGVRSLMDLE
ncbi:MAE_28990/MAE_18760 family HEPN-like nuclease [Stenotrophomonas sp. Marseille-Q5258]|uniref:HEPN domain-containing protein n=1 Tax=Stenotrophomonas sp. Marseille-Q5258 TaxID=2972779 RepID=UPI0021CA9841|nr:MAE_28990/MAE_18760 family HEPN-like nuclease [Stenotrophomonas sp. Marseille-Q5258]